jgi:murein DD-endopeptidase MepM/ murein hydrolase activator NlpD
VRCIIASLILFALAGSCQNRSDIAIATATPPPAWSVSANPTRLVNGAPVFFQVTAPAALASLTANWLGHTIVFDPASGKSWFAIAGVSLETKPGRYPLKLEGVARDGTKLTFEEVLTVGAQKYPTVQLTVSRQYTAPSPEQQEIIKQDQEIKKKAFAEESPEREWAGKFAAPVDAPVSDVFGIRRVFNGVTKSVHQGLDYRVPAATPVAAINAGKVILARPLYFEGNCVVIDHGQGLLTLYLHLSEFKVKEGELVKRGQQIGLSGASGRATGPHLHLAVRWQGTYLDPAVLLSLPVPGA